MYGIGVIGLGTMGMRVVDALSGHRQLHVVTAFDPHPRVGHSALSTAETAAAVIADPRVDCVYIASPPSSHAQLVFAAAQAGKAIFCEKPLTVNIEEARACVDIVRSLARPAAVNFPFARSPTANRLIKAVRTGTLGTISGASLTLRFATWPRGWQSGASTWLAGASEGGFTREVVSHFLFLALRLFGPGRVRTVDVDYGNSGTERRLLATIDYSGIVLTIDAAVEGSIEDYNEFVVTGSRDTAGLTDWYRFKAPTETSDRVPPLPAQIDGWEKMLSGDGAHGLATFEEAATVVEMVEYLRASTPRHN